MRTRIGLGLLLLGCSGFALGADAQRAVQQLRQNHPDAQLLSSDGQLERVAGTVFSTGATPEFSADAFVQSYSELWGVEAAELLPGNDRNDRFTQPVMWQADAQTYKFTMVYYRQVRDGLPVFDAGLKLLVRNEPDFPLVWAGSTLRDLGTFQVPAGVAQSRADNAAFAAALQRVPSLTHFTEPELVVWPGEPKTTGPAVAIVFIGDNYSARTNKPEKRRFIADAQTGAILHEQDMIIFTNVTGNVSGMATEGFKADICNNEVSTGLPYALVTITGGNSAYADVNGNFTITHGGTTAVTVTSPMSGQYFIVDNAAGGEETL